MAVLPPDPVFILRQNEMGAVNCICFHKTDRLFCGTAKGSVYLWDLQVNKIDVWHFSVYSCINFDNSIHEKQQKQFTFICDSIEIATIGDKLRMPKSHFVYQILLARAYATHNWNAKNEPPSCSLSDTANSTTVISIRLARIRSESISRSAQYILFKICLYFDCDCDAVFAVLLRIHSILIEISSQEKERFRYELINLPRMACVRDKNLIGIYLLLVSICFIGKF